MKCLALITLLLATSLAAQEPPLATGLRAPIEVAFTSGGNLIVSEAGNGPNTGRISLVDRAVGGQRTLVDGLPSGIALLDESAPSGPAGVALASSTLYVTIGSGDAVRSGPLPGTEVPGATSSPILSSVLALRADPSLDITRGDFVLAPSQHATLKSGQTVTLTNSAGDHLEVRLVVDFPNTAPNPRPDFPQNLRVFNPFRIAAAGQTLFVVDASQNVMQRVNANTGEYTTWITFPSLQNPTALGPPLIDAVPNSVRIRGNELLVTTLTGFPFPQGLGEVRRINMSSGTNERLTDGLTAAIDVQPLGESASSPFLVLEFSTDMLAQMPGRLRLFSPGALPVTIAEGLITPTAMAVDRRSGEVFVTELALGILVRINAAALVPLLPAGDILPVIGSTAGAFNSRFRTAAQLTNPNDFAISGRIVFHPQGRIAATGDPALTYSLKPFETRSFSDVVQAAGGSGVGTADLIPAVGGTPALVVRVIDDASAFAPSLQIPLLDAAEQLEAGSRSAIITPQDASKARLNVGIRTLATGVRMNVQVYSTDGTLVRSRELTYPANYFEQTPASGLTNGAIESNQSIVFRIVEGSAIVYGASTNNDGSGLTLQIASAVNN